MFGSSSFGSHAYGGSPGVVSAFGDYVINLRDVIRVSEDINAFLEGLGDVFSALVLEGINLSDVPLFSSTSFINGTDMISIGEQHWTEAFSFVIGQDTLSLEEIISSSGDTFANTSDTITSIEDLRMLLSVQINLQSLVGLSEAVSAVQVFLAHLEDSVGIGEHLDFNTIISLSPFEVIVTEEGLTFMVPVATTVEDQLTATDFINVAKVSLASVFESLSISEQKSVESFITIHGDEVIQITGDTVFFIPVSLSALENISVTDTAGVTHVLLASIYDQLGDPLEDVQTDSIRFSPGIGPSKKIGWATRSRKYMIGGTGVSW